MADEKPKFKCVDESDEKVALPLTRFKTDTILKGANSKPFWKVNLAGTEVEVRRITFTGMEPFFNAYAELKGSNILSDRFLDYPTFREGDWVGVDTAHSFNDGQSEAEKFGSALSQIENVILNWKKAVKEGCE